jgi:NifU-like protein involved in Fe-S cluster formation
MPMHSAKLLEYFQDARRAGELGGAAERVRVENPVCGDILWLSVRFDSGIAAEARFQVRGCVAAIAAGSALAEWVEGRTAAAVGGVTVEEIEAALGGLTNETRHAAWLARDAARAMSRSGTPETR